MTKTRNAERDKAETLRLRAEADRIKTESEINRLHIVERQIDLEQKQRIEEELLALDSYHETYPFRGQVCDQTVKDCIDKLTFWDRTKPGCPMEIIFNSPGGDVFSGMELFDFIQELRRRDHKITTSARGMAASMASILLQAGDRRVIGVESYILIHEVSSWADGKIGEMKDQIKFLDLLSDRVVQIFANRAAQAGRKDKSIKPITATGIRKNWNRKDWWIDSSEALKLGIVDELR
jgi:ATP-dependent protease ClpP protease subunit